jgi:hypothetical protein
MPNTDGTSLGYPKKSVYVYHFCVSVRFPQKVEEIAHGRDGGTNQPHHPNHGKRDTFYPERVNN